MKDLTIPSGSKWHCRRPLALLLLVLQICWSGAQHALFSDVHKVQVLKDDDFAGAIEQLKAAERPLLVEFYAPWCGHCRKLAPVLDSAAIEVANKLAIAKVDADKNKKLAKEFGITHFPTLKFLVDGHWDDYEGDRSEQGLIRLAERLSRPAVVTVGSPEELKRLVKERNIVFLLAKGKKGDSKSVASHALQQVAAPRRHNATFAVSSSDQVAHMLEDRPVPFLAKLESGEDPLFYEGDDLKDVAAVSRWVDGNNFALMTPLDESNFKKLGSQGKLMVIGVTDPEEERTGREFVAGVKEVAKALSTADRDRLVFGTLNGAKWGTWLQQFNVQRDQLPRIFVLDLKETRFWEDPAVKTNAQMEQFLADVVAGRISPKNDGGLLGLPRRAYKKFTSWLPYSLLGLAPFLVLLWGYCITVNDLEGEEGSGAPLQGRKPRAVGGDAGGEPGGDAGTNTGGATRKVFEASATASEPAEREGPSDHQKNE